MWRHIPTVFGGRPPLPAELPQRPAPDPLAGPDGSVIITVGAHPRVAVPDIRGRDEDDALSVLREAGLGADRRAARRSDRVLEGHVVRTRPRAGTEVATGTRISYVVAAGPRDVAHGGRRRDRRSRRVARMSDGSFLRPG